MVRTISRTELVAIIDEASKGCVASTRQKMRTVAETAPAVAVGWWHCGGVGCPARQASRKNQWFQERYDRAMYAHFGIEAETDAFVVTVSV